MEIFSRPEQWLARGEQHMCLDQMNIRIDTTPGMAAKELVLTEVFSSSGERRIVPPCDLPYGELPERPDFFRQAQRYLG